MCGDEKLQVWVRPTAEMQFLYGNHVLKSGLGRITEGTPAYTGACSHSPLFTDEVPILDTVTNVTRHKKRSLNRRCMCIDNRNARCDGLRIDKRAVLQ